MLLYCIFFTARSSLDEMCSIIVFYLLHPLHLHHLHTGRQYTVIGDIDASHAGQHVLIRARVHLSRPVGITLFMFYVLEHLLSLTPTRSQFLPWVLILSWSC